jgi:hypothetical protein
MSILPLEPVSQFEIWFQNIVNWICILLLIFVYGYSVEKRTERKCMNKLKERKKLNKIFNKYNLVDIEDGES